jgi:uncharacterized protein YkwD
MRGGNALLAIGAALMVVALCFAAAVVAYAARQDASRQALTPAPAAVPAEAAPAEQIVEPRPTDAADVPNYERFDIPESPRNASESRDLPAAPPPAPDPHAEVLSLEGQVPAANTTTLVEVRTCEGDTFALSVAEKRMLDLHNRARTQRGLGALCLSPDLTPIARARSQDMLDRDYFSHYTPQGTTVMDELERLGYFGPEAFHLVGEIIARGGNGTDTDTPEYMFDGLMHSPGHRENILNEGYTEVGIGTRSGTYQHYDDTTTVYTVVFGGYG